MKLSKNKYRQYCDRQGTTIDLSGDEVAMAIYAYLVAHGVFINGARTVSVNGELCKEGRVFVDPSGSVNHNQLSQEGKDND